MKVKRVLFQTNIDEQVIGDFKAYCQEQSVPMNRVIETFMNGYTQGRFKVAIEYDKLFDLRARKEYNNDKILRKVKNSRAMAAK